MRRCFTRACRGWNAANAGSSIVEGPFEEEDLAFLINAVHFDASWRVRFDPARTEEMPFHLLDGSTAPARFMIRRDTIQYQRTDRFDAVDLPYGGGAYSMTAVVPRGEGTVAELVEDLDEAAWDDLVSGFASVDDVHVYLPRFEMEWGGALEPALERLGMGVAFDREHADFWRMFDSQFLAAIWINEVKQRALVRVDESGTEAAAATSVRIQGVKRVQTPPEFRADRPFLFALRERLSGTILFAGVVVEVPRL